MAADVVQLTRSSESLRSRACAMLSQVAPTEATTSTATMAVSTQRAFPGTERRIWANTHTASATITGGHTQFNVVRVAFEGASTIRAVPAAPMAIAGTMAHRCGCTVRRMLSAAISATRTRTPAASTR